jgi:hypothetical protein
MGPRRSPDPERSRVWGYDAVRLGAMGWIALRHLLSISGIENHLVSSYLGVGAFSTLSGFLALRSRGDSLGWLSKRLVRIYVPYWVTLIAILTADWLFRYKPLSPGLVVSQFLGLAYFTHRGQLIGVHLWFISLILLCYGMAALIRWKRGLLPILVALALGLMSREDPKFAGCVLAFLSGGIIALMPRMWPGACLVAGVCLVASANAWTVFAYPLAGVAALMVGTLLSGKEPRIIALASGIVYEFFLTHGPIYLGLSRIAGFDFRENLILGTLLAVMAAWALRRGSRTASSGSRAILLRVSRRLRPLSGHGRGERLSEASTMGLSGRRRQAEGAGEGMQQTEGAARS